MTNPIIKKIDLDPSEVDGKTLTEVLSEEFLLSKAPKITGLTAYLHSEPTFVEVLGYYDIPDELTITYEVRYEKINK